MSKLNKALYVLSDLHSINKALIPLKEIADRELRSIYGLTGKVYTPHLDEYMQVCLTKAQILVCLKQQNIIAISDVEVIHNALNSRYKTAKHRTTVEYEGNSYERRFLPLKLSKSGKNVQKWAKFWLLLQPDGKACSAWERQVREIWPSYYLIRTIEM